MTDNATPTTTPTPAAAPAGELHQLRDLVDKHGKTATTIACAVLMAFAAGLLWRNHVQIRKQNAARLLTSATAAPDLQTVATEFASTPAAPLALLKLAKAHYDSGNFDMAMNTYREFEDTYPGHDMAETAALGKAHCLEGLKQPEQALAAFQAFATEYPKHYLTPQAILGQGRCLEQLGRAADARIVYEDFLAAHPKSPWAMKMEESLKTLKAASGNTSATNTPPAAAVQPAPVPAPQP